MSDPTFTAPLTAQQEALWVVTALDPDDDDLVVRSGLVVAEDVTLADLTAAASTIADRHETLRTTIATDDDGRPVQLIHPPGTFVPRILAASTGEPLSGQGGGRLPDPTEHPPWQLHWDHAADAESGREVRVEAHHLIVDGRATALWLDELAAVLGAAPAELAPPDLQPADYAASQLAWRRLPLTRSLVERRATTIGSGRPVLPVGETGRPPGREQLQLEVSPAAARQLRLLAAEAGDLALWTAVLTLALGERGRGPVLCTVVDHRPGPEWAGVVGCFTDAVGIVCDELDDRSPTRLTPAEIVAAGARSVRSALDSGMVPLTDLTAAVSRLGGPVGQLTRYGLRVAAPGAAPEPTPFDLQFVVQPDGERSPDEPDGGRSAAVLTLTYRRDRLRADIARSVLTRVVDTAEALVGQRSEPWDGESVAQQVRRQARARPTTLAVTGFDGRLGYQELVLAADRIAAAVRSTGRARRVGMLCGRSSAVPAAMLGTWTAGATYVPLDPQTPLARLRTMSAAAGLDLLLYDEKHAELAGELRRPDHLLDPEDPALLPVASLQSLLQPDRPDPAATLRSAPRPGHDPGDGPGPDRAEPAYLMFTSGSTGTPKGVLVGHRALASVVEAMVAECELDACCVWLALTAPTFDISLLELLAPLVVGGTVVVAPEGQTNRPDHISRLAREHGATTIQATPSTWRLLTAADDLLELGDRFAECGTVLVGGEALTPDLAGRLRRLGRRQWNVYGPTEATIWASAYRLDREPPDGWSDPVSVGRALASAELRVCRADGTSAEDGEVGELLISGRCLAEGYLDALPSMTRFVVDERGVRWYRTGDEGVRRPDGSFLFRGRTDDQVKIRGFRVEPGDCEQAIRTVPGVHEVVVVAEPDASGALRLIAHVVWTGAEPFEPSAIIKAAATRLPPHLVPSQVRPLPRLPLTRHGKVDRAALLDKTPVVAVASDDELTQRVLGIAAEVLGTPVGPDDDFFLIGGHSLLMVHLLARLRAEIAPTLSLRDLFDRPRLAELVETVRAAATAAQPEGPLPTLTRRPR